MTAGDALHLPSRTSPPNATCGWGSVRASGSRDPACDRSMRSTEECVCREGAVRQTVPRESVYSPSPQRPTVAPTTLNSHTCEQHCDPVRQIDCGKRHPEPSVACAWRAPSPTTMSIEREQTQRRRFIRSPRRKWTGKLLLTAIVWTGKPRNAHLGSTVAAAPMFAPDNSLMIG